MAQSWESPEIRKQGFLWKQANKSGNTEKMAAAKAEAERLRGLQGYQTDASGLNQQALQGYQADSTNTKFTPIVQQPQIQQPQYDLTAKLNELKNAQIANSIAGLDQARNKSVQAINTEKAGIAPQYQGLRNTAQTQSDMKVKNLAEYMANRGSLGAGGNNQIRTSMETANMNNQSGLYRQEQSALDDIARRLTGVEQDYQTGVQQAKAGADVQFIQNTLNELGKLRDYGREDSRNAVMDNRYNTEWNYKTTTDQRDFNYQKQQDQLDRDFQQKSFDAEQKYRNGQITLQQKQQEIDNAFREKEFARSVLESDRNYKLSASKSSGSSGGVVDSKTQSNNYRDASAQFASYSPNDALKILNDDTAKQSIINQVGVANHEKLVKEAQDRNLDALLNVLGSMTSVSAYNSLVNSAQDYISRVGRANYDKVLAEYKKKSDAVLANR